MSARRSALAVALLTLAACSADPIAPATQDPGLAPNDKPSFYAGVGTIVVAEHDVARQVEGSAPTNNWVLYTRAGTPATAAVFGSGPVTPPSGVGSLQLATLTSSEKVFLFNFDHMGTKLSDIDAINYSTYRTAGSGQQVTALNLVIDYNGPNVDGGFSTLVFEPVYNTDQDPVVSGEWQQWNGLTGTWWSTRAINGQCVGATAECDKTWAEILAANPDATILGGIGVNQGSGNEGLSSAVDRLTFDQVTYDFEPYHVAANIDACKNGGWKAVKSAEGGSFKNQGECVAYVARQQ